MIIKSAARVLILSSFFIELVSQATELKSVGSRHVSEPYRTVFEEVGNLEYKVSGYSFLGDSHTFKTEAKKGLKTAYLIWAGVVEDRFKKDAQKIYITLQADEGDREIEIKTNTFLTIKDEGTKIAYAAVINITTLLKKERIQKITHIAKHEIGGYAIIEIYNNENVPKRYIGMKVGIARLKPGDIYHIHLVGKEQRNGIVSQVSMIGAGAIAGNGSANGLNEVTLSGKEEWDGSSGPKWDIDTFNVETIRISTKEGLLWSIDPLLQWIYPVGAVVQVDHLKEGGKP